LVKLSNLENFLPNSLFSIKSLTGLVQSSTKSPLNLSKLQNVFLVSQLHTYIHDPLKVTKPDIVHIWEKLTYDVFPMSIENWRIKKLWKIDIPLVKVLRSQQEDIVGTRK